MRKIAAGVMVSLDGVVEAPETWTGPYFNPQIGQHVGSMLAAADTLLLGRITYQTFAAAFAGSEGNPMAEQMNSFHKVVVSTSLTSADWHNSTLIRDKVTEQIADLKSQPGANINISGSATLIRTLLPTGLIDELDLLVFPLVVGTGKRLFSDNSHQQDLNLTSSQAFDNGVLHLTYQPA